MRREEKGADVSLASNLIHDAHRGLFDRAVIISNDSDLAEALRIVKEEVMDAGRKARQGGVPPQPHEG